MCFGKRSVSRKCRLCSGFNMKKCPEFRNENVGIDHEFSRQHVI